MAKVLKGKLKSKKATKNRSGCTLTPKNGDGKKNKNKVGRKNGTRTIKEKLFIEEYLKDFNATRAYMVSHGGEEMTVETAGSGGCQLLKKLKVMQEIDGRITDMFSRLEISNEMLIAGYINEIYNDQRNFFDENEEFVGMHNLNIAQQACIESVEKTNVYKDVTIGKGKKERVENILVGVKTRIKFYSKQAAKNSLMRYKGLIKDTHIGTLIVDNRKVEVNIEAAKLLKEKLGAGRITQLNRLLEKTSSN